MRVRIGARPFDLPKLIPEGAAAVRAHAGNGIARLDYEKAPDFAALQARAAERGGYAVVESAPADLPGREGMAWGFPGDRLMQAIRAARDPKGILNRGRMAV